MRFTTTLFALVAFASSALAHMEMTDPAPFRSKFNEHAKTPDFDMSSPLSTDASNFPCKGYQSDFNGPEGDPTATWAAGSPQKVTLDDSAAHGGGSCQVSLSYDEGKTFRVVRSLEGGCVNPAGGEHSFDFTVPDDAKSGKAIFAWTWFNEIGNREMYMNCAAVTITGSGTSTLDDRPEIFVANIKNDNNCKVAEGTDVKFPDPGPDPLVISDAKLGPPTCDSSSSPPDESVDPTTPAEPADPADPADPTSTSTSSAAPTGSATPTDDDDYTDEPVASRTSTSAPTGSGSATPTDAADPTEEPVTSGTSTTSAPTTTSTTDSGTGYTVKAGDICIAIAAQQSVSLDTLFKLNPAINKDCTNLEIGQTLVIRRRSRIMRDLN